MVKNTEGQSLLEVLIALSVIILVVTALVRVVTLSIRSTDYSRNTSVAVTYATEAMEKIRSFRDSMSWTNFSSLNSSAKFFTAVTTSATYSIGTTCPDFTLSTASGYFSDARFTSFLIDNQFFRCTKFEYSASDDNTKVTVTVYWLENDQVKSSINISYFYNWK